VTSRVSRGALTAAVASCLLSACSVGAASATSTRPSGTPRAATSSRAGTAPASSTSPEHRGGEVSSPCGRLSKAPTYRHIIWILMENNSYGAIVGSSQAPYLNSLLTRCGIASNYHNITHHSLANYVGLTDGAKLSALRPYDGDCLPARSCEVTGTNLFHQARSWKSYDESMPSRCYKQNTSLYAPRHNPAVYYTDLTDCSKDDVPLGTAKNSPLVSDFSSETTAPALSFVTPNLCDDMHGAGVCGANLVAAGDSWLRTWIGLITRTHVYASGDTAVFIVWDEGAGGTTGEACANNTKDQSCHVPLFVVAPSVRPGTVDKAQLNHYSLLKTTEALLGYPALGLAASAASLKAGFNL
jgi:hypothetical protein